MQLREYLPYDVRDVMRTLPPDGEVRHKIRRFTLNPRVDGRARSVAEFAKDLGFGVDIEPLPRGMNGKLLPDPWSVTGQRIVVSSKVSREAQRFSVLHEMGHYFRHSDFEDPFAEDHFDLTGVNVFYDDPTKEREANEFAEALLFGGAQLAAAVGLLGSDLPKLSKYFGVTEMVVAIALRKLRR